MSQLINAHDIELEQLKKLHAHELIAIHSAQDMAAEQEMQHRQQMERMQRFKEWQVANTHPWQEQPTLEPMHAPASTTMAQTALADPAGPVTQRHSRVHYQPQPEISQVSDVPESNARVMAPSPVREWMT